MTVASDGRDWSVASSFLKGAPAPALASSVSAEPQFARNRARMRALVDQLQEALATARACGS